MFNKIFKLSYHHTTIKKEILAGIITFFTTVYIIFVNPIILSQAGLDIQQVFISTCLVIFLSGTAIALVTNTPFMMGPGLGINAMFVYDIVINKGYSCNVALLTVFLSGILGIIFFLLIPSRAILKSIPDNLKAGIIAGTGLFILLIGLKLCGIVLPNQNTFSNLGNIMSVPPLFGFLAFFTLYICYNKNINFFPILTIIIFAVSILINLIICNDTPLLHSTVSYFSLSSYKLPYFPLELSALKLPLLAVVISLFLAANCDSLGTYLTCKTSLDNSSSNTHPLSSNILFKKLMVIKGGSTMIAGLIGCSNTSLFLESTAGIKSGGKTGLVALTVAFLFLIALALKPLLAIIPEWSGGPILLVVGTTMFTFGVQNIKWNDYSEFLPSLFALIFIPITFSISNGMAICILSYIIIKILSGKIKDIGWLSLILGIIFLVYLLV